MDQLIRLLLSHGADPVPRNTAETRILEEFLRHGDKVLAKEVLFAPSQVLSTTIVLNASRILTEDEMSSRLLILTEPNPCATDFRIAIRLSVENSLAKVFERLVNHAQVCNIDESVYIDTLAVTARRSQPEMFDIVWKYLLRKNSLTKTMGATEIHESSPVETRLQGPIQERMTRLLHDAAQGGSTHIFNLLLFGCEEVLKEKLAAIDESIDTKLSALAACAKHHASPDSAVNQIREHGPYYLLAAVNERHASMTDLLLRLGTDPNTTYGRDEEHALCSAIVSNTGYDIILSLVKAGAKLNSRMTRMYGPACYRVKEHGTALAMAILHANTAEIIQVLLDNGADPNTRVYAYGSVLQLAVSKRHMEAVNILLASGANVDHGGGSAHTPLIAAIVFANDRVSPDVELIQLLLEHKADANTEYEGPIGTPIKAALKKLSGSFGVQVLQLLVSYGAKLPPDVLELECSGWPYDALRAQFLLSKGAKIGGALPAACLTGKPLNLIETLIAKGADVNAEGGKYGTALQAACVVRSDTTTVEFLLRQGAIVNTDVGYYGNALQAAAATLSLPKVKLLLAHSADINALGGEFGSALQAACDRARDKEDNVAKYLLENGSQPNIRGGKYGYALICAATSVFESLTSINVLLDHGADINCTHEKYGNALSAACLQSHKNPMMLLIDRGISLTELSGEHDHALFVACLKSTYGHVDDERVKLLLDRGVDPNIHGIRYSCALEAAILANNSRAVKLLIDRGADSEVQAADGSGLLHTAASQSSPVIVKMLLDHGSQVGAIGGQYCTIPQAACARKPSADAEKVLEMLLSRGASVHTVGGKYGTALHAALHFRNKAAVMALLDNGAQITEHIKSCDEGCAQLCENGEIRIQSFDECVGSTGA